MEKYYMAPTDTSPKVEFDLENQKYEIIGRSFPEDPSMVFEPILEFIERVFPTIDHHIQLKVDTEYFNSASSRYMLVILKELERLHTAGKQVTIIWLYEDDDLKADGEMYNNLIAIPFEYVKIK